MTTFVSLQLPIRVQNSFQKVAASHKFLSATTFLSPSGWYNDTSSTSLVQEPRWRKLMSIWINETKAYMNIDQLKA